jgi:dihydroflavonol-4-reductase
VTPERVLVTGAGGFIGSAITRELLSDGHSVVALIEPGADTHALDGLDVEVVVGDLRDAAAVRKAVVGCQSVFHVAALYRFWSRDPREFYDINVGGTRNVLAAARDEAVERVVYTSTVGTLGLDHDRPASELDYPDVSHLFGSYKRSKYVAEHEVLRACAEGLPVVLALPTYPIGPGDRAPTPSGRLVVDFLDGRGAGRARPRCGDPGCGDPCPDGVGTPGRQPRHRADRPREPAHLRAVLPAAEGAGARSGRPLARLRAAFREGR